MGGDMKGREFEGVDEITVPATPEQVWDAVATGPGIDSWFMGRNEVEAGTAVRMAFGGYTPEHAITAWEPGERLAYGSSPAPDGRFIAYEFLIEGRDRSSTVLRMVTSGFLPGDDWADEFEAMQHGGQLFFRTLVEYLTHFPGRTATPVTVFGPRSPTGRALAALLRAARLLEAAVPLAGAVLHERRHHRRPHGGRVVPLHARLPRARGGRPHLFHWGWPGLAIRPGTAWLRQDHTGGRDYRTAPHHSAWRATARR